MRNLLNFILIVGLAWAINGCSSSSKSAKGGWSGTVIYDITYSGDNITPVMTANLAKTATVKYYQDMQSFETVTGPVVQTIIVKPSSKKRIVLIEYGLKKVGVVVKDTADSDSLSEYLTHVELINESKTIAGHECGKAMITETPKDPNSDKEEKISDLYYAKDMDGSLVNTEGEESKIPGIPLQFEKSQNGLTMKFVAREVKAGGVSELDFMIPSDYKIVPADKIQEELFNK